MVVYIFKGVMEMKNKQQTENKENNKNQNNIPSAKEQYNIILKLQKNRNSKPAVNRQPGSRQR